MSRIVLVFVLTLGCYQAHERGSDASVVLVDGGTDVGIDGGTDGGGRLCGCPGSPTAHVCVLPLMCCPATQTCEDPAHFSCTGSNPCR
jgi:hypothetical protein